MINVAQLRDFIITPTLKSLSMYSESAVNLLLGTCAQESQMGTYLKQIGTGPALGIYQIEPTTYFDICRYVKAKFAKEKDYTWLWLTSLSDLPDDDSVPNPDKLISDLKLATAMCRIHYWRQPEKLPEADDIAGLAAYWKKYYNTVKGKGTEQEFIANYKRYVLNEK